MTTTDNSEIVPATLGPRIRQHRQALNWTLQDLSNACGVSVANLSKIETGAQDMRMSTFERITTAIQSGRRADAGGGAAGFGVSRPAAIAVKWLTFDEVQAQLPINGQGNQKQLALTRLLALGLLDGRRLGDADGAPWRISDISVNDFINDNCPRMQLPDLRGVWFDDRSAAFKAGDFTSKIIAAMPLPASAPAKPGDSTPDVVLPLTAAAIALCKAPVPPPIDGSKPGPFKNAAEIYLVERIRLFAFQQTSADDPKKIGGVNWLYQSVEMFNDTTAAAIARLKTSVLPFSADYPVPEPQGRASTFRVGFKIKDVDILAASGATPDRLIGLAF